MEHAAVPAGTSPRPSQAPSLMGRAGAGGVQAAAREERSQRRRAPPPARRGCAAPLGGAVGGAAARGRARARGMGTVAAKPARRAAAARGARSSLAAARPRTTGLRARVLVRAPYTRRARRARLARRPRAPAARVGRAQARPCWRPCWRPGRAKRVAGRRVMRAAARWRRAELSESFGWCPLRVAGERGGAGQACHAPPPPPLAE